MGYHTNFDGEFTLNRTLAPEHKLYLEKFADTRRMKRNAQIATTLEDPVRIAAKLPIGREGGYFVGGKGMCGQSNDDSVENHNMPPEGQPGLWCQWVPNEEGDKIRWDYGEKFYYYVEWLEYIIKHFLEPWEYKLSGEVYWYGEDSTDLGKITVTDNEVNVKYGEIHYV